MEMRIKITENGPYIVTGGIPISEMLITRKLRRHVLAPGRPLPQAESYALCRCGLSTNPPFCDGAHGEGFDGTEVASREPYATRATKRVEGSTMTLLDDGRCAYARFCHLPKGSIWDLTRADHVGNNREEALRAAAECPTGRFVFLDKEGNELGEDPEPEIIILHDVKRRASSGIFVRGHIIIEAADGTEYEPRRQVALCRCGRSKEKPFCDAEHLYGFKAEGLKYKP